MLDLTEILQKVVALLCDIKLGGKKSRREVAALDSGVLKIAVMIAALDGEILPGEYAAFEPLLKSCRGYGHCSAAATFEKLLEGAGRVLMMAQAGRHSDEERLAVFKKLALEALPVGFKEGSMADLRRAFALWQVMAMSDGSVSDLERAALKLLLTEFAGVSADELAKPCRRGGSPRQDEDVSRLSQTRRAAASTLEEAELTMLLEEDFLTKVEQTVHGLADPATRKAAQDELLALVTTIVLQDGVKSRRHQACRVMVATLLGIAAAMSALGGKMP